MDEREHCCNDGKYVDNWEHAIVTGCIGDSHNKNNIAWSKKVKKLKIKATQIIHIRKWFWDKDFKMKK